MDSRPSHINGVGGLPSPDETHLIVTIIQNDAGIVETGK